MRVGGSDRLFAIGDVNGRGLFTHVGKYQAWIVAQNLLGHDIEAVAEDIGSPRVTFTDPQVAAVGKTLAEAEAAGIDARAVEVPTDRSPRERSSAPPSPASRPPTFSRRRRWRSSPRCHCRDCATRSLPTPRVVRSG
jgi:hypothetical protein